ncbi:hypothetical protein [Polaribacter sp. L3A8]|uniref:hypothetical protein n=1 Tax=Polaribacter sp. L3A8 TaxID=2686361 RepID=UPI00131E6593|nr:hypothetical protein [Polaribacter sp. L3A8]
MESKRKQKENEWLVLLENAINENVEIQVNHRFKYNNKNLGTFLVSAKRKQNLELIRKIESLGVNFKMHSKNPEDYLEKFTLQLSTDKKPNKQKYITRFNAYILPKKELVKEQNRKKLNSVWEIKFGDIRKWEKPETTIDKIKKWKNFRYNEKLNPTGKWFDYKKKYEKIIWLGL